MISDFFCREGLKFSLWDKIVIQGNDDMTMQQFLTQAKVAHNILILI